jgi:hypothetical protein
MPLPRHLQRYDSLIDFLVEEFVREVEEGADVEAQKRKRPPVQGGLEFVVQSDQSVRIQQ